MYIPAVKPEYNESVKTNVSVKQFKIMYNLEVNSSGISEEILLLNCTRYGQVELYLDAWL